ncbi:MAG: LytTR family DNA-binding domain-containing protein [Lactobacillales bacterium]|jgi:two-component system response regulator AgrA|nr:LytTR family DNA-binding domain-containing protein [Lactobacillales bacterium]
MLNVYICEDDEKQRHQIEKIVQNYLFIEDYDMTIQLTSPSPEEILHEVQAQKQTNGLYLLDVDLQAKMNGIELAAKIRETDTLGTIVFITTHDEMAYLTFSYKVEAMEYILKEDSKNMRQAIADCLKIANDRQYKNSDKRSLFTFKLGAQWKSAPYDEILFFETSPTPHKIILHMENAQLEFYGSIKELAQIDPRFIRCHKSYVVNKDKIRNINLAERTVEISNGETCLVSVRALGKLKQPFV